MKMKGSFLLVANQQSKTIVVFTVDEETGKLSTPCSYDVFSVPTPENVTHVLDFPTCLVIADIAA